MPHHPHHGPGGPPHPSHGPGHLPPHGEHHHPPGERWLVNIDEIRSLATVAPILANLFAELGTSGNAKLGDHIVAPPDEVELVLRFVRGPHHRALIAELRWHDAAEYDNPTDSFDALLGRGTK